MCSGKVRLGDRGYTGLRGPVYSKFGKGLYVSSVPHHTQVSSQRTLRGEFHRTRIAFTARFNEIMNEFMGFLRGSWSSQPMFTILSAHTPTTKIQLTAS